MQGLCIKKVQFGKLKMNGLLYVRLWLRFAYLASEWGRDRRHVQVFTLHSLFHTTFSIVQKRTFRNMDLLRTPLNSAVEFLAWICFRYTICHISRFARMLPYFHCSSPQRQIIATALSRVDSKYYHYNCNIPLQLIKMSDSLDLNMKNSVRSWVHILKDTWPSVKKVSHLSVLT